MDQGPEHNAQQGPQHLGVAGAQCSQGWAGAHARQTPADAENRRANEGLAVPLRWLGQKFAAQQPVSIPAAQRVLAEAFPASIELNQRLDFGEPGPQLQEAAYSREHAEIFRPIQACFDLIREISIAVAHDIP